MKLDSLFQKNTKRRLGMAVGIVLLIWLAGWLLVPPLLKAQAQKHLSELLGRQVTLGGVGFKPWSLELEVTDFAVAQAGALGQPPQFAIKRLYVDLEAQSLFRLAPVVDALQMVSPHLRLKHLGGGHYDVDDILKRISQGPAEPDAKPLRFALYNLKLSDGQVLLDDAPKGKVHTLRDLTLTLPFLSNLDSNREIHTRPELAFELNGSKFDTSAQSTPFTETRKTQARIHIPALDLKPYLEYLPDDAPVHLGAGVLSADLTIDFAQTTETHVSLNGRLAATQVKLVGGQARDPAAAELLSFDALNIQLKDTRPLARQINLESLELVKPELFLARDKAGGLNWQALARPAKTQTITASQADAPKAPEKAAPDASNTGTKQKDDQNTSAWTVSVANIKLQDGLVHWADSALPKPAQLDLSALNLSVNALRWPFQQAASFEGQAMLDKSSLNFSGSATDAQAALNAKVADLSLSAGAAYLQPHLKPRLEGMLNAELGLTWKAEGGPDQPMALALQIPNLTLDKVALTPAGPAKDGRSVKATLASIKGIHLAQVMVDVQRHTVSLGQLSVTQPNLGLQRLADGRWMFEDWLVPASPGTSQGFESTPAKPNSDGRPLQLALGELNLSQGDLTFADAMTPTPVAFAVSALNLKVKNLAWPAIAKAKTITWTMAAQMRHGATEPGTLNGRGTATLNPTSVQADLNAQRLPLHALAPYFASVAKLDLQRADSSFKGHVGISNELTGLALQLKGDVKLEDLRAQTLAQLEPYKPAEELLSWKDLSLDGLDLVLQPDVAPHIEVAQTSLSDFFAKLTLSEAGRLNLQDVTANEPGPAAATADSSPPAGTMATQNTTNKIAASEGNKVAMVENGAQDQLAPVIKFGPMSLTNGRVDFNDRFIKPNYSARLSELTGRLSAFSSVAPDAQVQLADLELRGRVEGTASLEILGKVNPLAKPVALDIQGRVRDLELAPLSTYSARYAGYGIERGKLSVDVAYKVQPDGQLTASNNIVLNQLKFGDAVAGAERSLPVKLAVALLADRNGVIDIDLPVSGSLNDPQFRIGPIVFKLIVNLIVKAVTAPFSLLASAFGGGGDELSMVSFAPGSAALEPASKAGLDKVAKALVDRPALKMTVVGTASLEVEREGFKQDQLQAMLQAEKRRALGIPGNAVTPAVTSDEYPKLLKAVYKRADFPKPRNLIGLAKDLPAPEMETLLLANLPVTDAAIQDLATQRGVVVRDYLASLKLPLERLFLGAAKAVPPEAKWRPHAELSLATQ